MSNRSRSFVFKGRRGLREIDLGGNQEQLIEAIRTGGILAFDVRQVTKTQLSVEIFNELITLRSNIKLDGFKFAEKNQYNQFSSTFETDHYFKLLKTQGKTEFELYLSKLIEHISMQLEIEINQDVFNVHCRDFSF